MAALVNPQWEKFCVELITNVKNGTQAAIAAGYTQRSAYSQATRLLKKAEVFARIEELKEELKSAKIADAQEVLETLTRIIRREETEEQVVVLTNRTPTLDDKTGKTKSTTQQEAQVVDMKPPIASVNKAAELLGKYYTLFTDRLVMDKPLTVNIVDDIPPQAPARPIGFGEGQKEEPDGE